MRPLVYSSLLCLGFAALTLPARAADDIIVNGQHCNSLCQSWLGLNERSAASAVRSDPPLVRQVQQRATEPTQLRLAVTRAKPIAPETRLRTAAREIGPASDASSVSATTEGGVERSGNVGSSAPLQPFLPTSAIHEKSPEIALPSIQAPRTSRAKLPPIPRLAPGRAVQPQPSEAVPDAHEDATLEDGTLPSHPRQRPKPVNAEASMEPGLKTLPHLNELVAVHGTIMIETQEDRAVARRNMADLVKATTRPKEFRTGFADPFADKPAAAQVVGQVR